MKNKGFWLFKLAQGSPGHGERQFWEILAACLFGLALGAPAGALNRQNHDFQKSRISGPGAPPGGFKWLKPFVFQLFFQPEPGPSQIRASLEIQMPCFLHKMGPPSHAPDDDSRLKIDVIFDVKNRTSIFGLIIKG